MKNFCVLGGGLAAAIAASAPGAVFTSWSTSMTTNAAGNEVWSLYANFDMAGLIFLNCFDHEDRQGTMGAIHADNFTDPDAGVFGSWAPLATNAALNSGDSYVTATGTYGGGATGTALDPSFNDNVGDGWAFHAGWYDGSPGVMNVMTQSYKVAQIVRSASAGFYQANLEIGFKVSNTTTALFGNALWSIGTVPAPGALALLGIAGLAARRRRA